MPRAKKTMGAINPGAPAQPLRVVTGGSYGEGKQLSDAQRAVPLPDNTTPTAAPAPMGNPLAAAAAYDPPHIDLGAPTAMPHQSVTQGLYDPQPAAAQGPSFADILKTAAQQSGNTSLLALANQAAALGQ